MLLEELPTYRLRSMGPVFPLVISCMLHAHLSLLCSFHFDLVLTLSSALLSTTYIAQTSLHNINTLCL